MIAELKAGVLNEEKSTETRKYYSRIKIRLDEETYIETKDEFLWVISEYSSN